MEIDKFIKADDLLKRINALKEYIRDTEGAIKAMVYRFGDLFFCNIDLLKHSERNVLSDIAIDQNKQLDKDTMINDLNRQLLCDAYEWLHDLEKKFEDL